MLTRPNDSDDRGRGLMVMTYPPPALADGDNNTQTGVVTSLPVWSSSPPPFSSIPTSPSCPSSALPSPPPISSTHLSNVSFSPPSSLDRSLPSLSTDSSSVTLFPCHHVTSNVTSAASSSPGSLSSGSSTPLIPTSTHSSISPAYFSHVLPPSSVPPSHSAQCHYLLPSQFLSSFSNVSPFPIDSPLSSAQSAAHYHTPTRISLPPPPPPIFTPCTSHTAVTVYPPCSSPTSSVSSSVLYPPVSLLHTAPVLPPVPPPCCSCSALLPRLLSAHRLEVRRLLRGALATLSRRLDSLERRTRRNVRKKRTRNAVDGGRGPCSHVSSTSPLNPSLTDQEEEAERNRKRRKKQREINQSFKKGEDKEIEEDEGRFVVRMAVSFTGEEEGATLILHKLNHRRRAESGLPQPEKAVAVFRPNGFRTPPMLPHSSSTLSYQSSSHLLLTAHSSQSDTLELSSGRWCFSNILLPLSFLSSHRAVHQWFSSSPLSCLKPTLQLKLSRVAAEMIVESMRRGACGSPLRPLKDWTAPPSLSTDHCYMRALSLSSPSDGVRQQHQQNHHRLHLPQRRPLPLSSCSTNGPSAGLPNGQTLPGAVVETSKERGKRVSQIRIRRAPPRETPLTPMGLPKVKRLKKKEFSLEEIYTNKNYKSPTSNRTLETIFEEPREKDGALLRIGHQRRRRLLLFPDFTQPRKRKRPSGIGLPVASMPRKRVASRRCHGSNPVEDESDVDVMLVERLSALEDFLTQQGLDV